MKIYSIKTPTDIQEPYSIYFGVVTKKRTGFKNEHIACVRTYIEHDGVPRYIPTNTNGSEGIMNIENAREIWNEKSKQKNIIIDSEGEDVLKSNGKEPMMDSEIILEMDTNARYL